MEGKRIRWSHKPTSIFFQIKESKLKRDM
jgi:hypothetical protein